VAQYLRDLGLEVRTGIGGYGVVGILNGNKDGKKIIWRADMDAVQTGFSGGENSEPKNKGVRHICGHDVHTTIGLGIANTLVHQAKNIDGTVYFLFQPAEETLRGAKAMINDGLYDLIKPDEVYGLHITPMETGVVSTKAGPLFSFTRGIRLEFDQADGADALTKELNSIIGSLTYTPAGANYENPQNLIDPAVGLINPDSIYQNYLIVQQMPTVRETEGKLIFESQFVISDEAKLAGVKETVIQRVLESRFGERLVSAEIINEVPAILNDTALTTAAIEAVNSIYTDAIDRHHGVIPFFNEDFAYFQQRVPGVYFFLGGSNAEQGIFAMPHSPEFAVDERSIEVGVNYFSSLILERAGAR
jgi:metal-dependent amidase/aminoacylase/carboxypeptidase family protein